MFFIKISTIKKSSLTLILCVIIALPFMLCSCFQAEEESVTLSKSELTLTVGESCELAAEILPDNSGQSALSWTSSDKDVVTVSSQGKLKAKSEGFAVVTVTTKGGLTDECQVEVKPVEVEKVVLDRDNVSVNVGKKIEISAKLQPVDAKNGWLLWKSSNEKVATVNDSGFVTGVSEGLVEISCTAENGVSASCIVTVKTEPSSSSGKDSSSKNGGSSKSSSSESGSSKSSSKSPSGGGDFIFPDSSTRKLRDSEASMLSSTQAQQAINEIYARNGYVFKTAEIQEFFESKSWYSPDPSFTMGGLNEIENYNIALLSKYR